MKRLATIVCLLSWVVLSIQGAAGAPSTSSRHVSGGRKPIDDRFAQEVIKRLNLTANPEKGYYIETFRDTRTVENNRSASTAIYYLLEGSAGPSLWHRIDAVELWHYYAGAPLNLSLSFNDGHPTRKVTLGPDVFNHQQPQVVIASWEWQSAQSLGDWTLVGTTVAPGFDPTQYEIEPEGWSPK